MEPYVKYYVVYGDPIALARARHSRGRVYDAQKHIKLVWGINIQRQHNNERPFEGPVFMDVIFYMPIPSTASQKKKDSLKDQWHILRPDSDNLLKFVCDVATSICYHDDCIIAKQSIEKVYDDGGGPRTEFIFSEIKGRREPRKLL